MAAPAKKTKSTIVVKPLSDIERESELAEIAAKKSLKSVSTPDTLSAQQASLEFWYGFTPLELKFYTIPIANNPNYHQFQLLVVEHVCGKYVSVGFNSDYTSVLKKALQELRKIV